MKCMIAAVTNAFIYDCVMIDFDLWSFYGT